MTDAEPRASVRHQLDSLLSDLYDFGEEFVTREEKVPDHGETNEISEEKKPEKVKGCPEEKQEAAPPKRGKKNVSMFFDAIKDELYSKAKTMAPSSSSSVDVVSFVSRKKQSKDGDVQDPNSEKNGEQDNILQFDLEKTRLEVHKFGLKGYAKETQRKYEKERAIMLGAKPPKREYVNYKLYQEQIKLKQLEKAKMENEMEPGRKKRKKEYGGRFKNRKSSLSAPSGQVGKFKDGALFLSQKDISDIKKSRVVKGV
ncbi:40S small subunit processome assembly factor 1 [Engystomops pustulosus]|uniref:40S small subunit processome assembly factor 1 n=1 Tax=Engystomops pustulosus TaxID=76066 RepID=UPI003AFA6C01